MQLSMRKFGLICLLSIQVLRSQPKASFVIDPNRPFVYVKFDHTGEAVGLAGESRTRIWLRIVNNCNLVLKFRSGGVPGGRPMGEVGIPLRAVPDELITTMTADAPEIPLAEGNDAVSSKRGDDKPARMIGYDFEVSSTSIIGPGKEILFSVPKEFLSRDWHLEIPFDFDLPRGTGPRPANVGGIPRMLVLYSVRDLPTGQHLLNH